MRVLRIHVCQSHKYCNTWEQMWEKKAMKFLLPCLVLALAWSRAKCNALLCMKHGLFFVKSTEYRTETENKCICCCFYLFVNSTFFSFTWYMVVDYHGQGHVLVVVGTSTWTVEGTLYALQLRKEVVRLVRWEKEMLEGVEGRE